MALTSFSSTDDDELPVDLHILAGETPYEIIDGELLRVPTADDAHAQRHAQLGVLLVAHASADFIVALDMLTRTSELNDFAPDASVFPRASHPHTGGRQLEHLAFEILSTTRPGRTGKKARELSRRGVRRVFAIDIERGRVLEWSRALDDWSMLDLGALIEDAALAVPLPVASLVTSVSLDDAMANVLLAKRNSVLAVDRLEGRLEGRLDGLREGILTSLAARGLAVDDAALAVIRDQRDVARLGRWLAVAATCASVAEVLAAR